MQSSSEQDVSAAPPATRRHRELLLFLFLAFVLIPILSIAVVGGYGFAVWMYQLIAGPPTG